MVKVITIFSALAFFLGASALAGSRDTIPMKASDQNDEAPALSKPNTDRESVKAVLSGLEVFGTSRIDEVGLRRLLGKDLEAWIQKGLSGDPKATETEEKLRKIVAKKLGFILAEWSINQEMTTEGLAVYITLDVVEKKDQAKRMPFHSPPKEELPDPGNLIAAWIEYENLAFDLIEKDELDSMDVKCNAFHCPFGHSHEKLKKYEKIFVEGVKQHEGALIKVLNSDKRVDNRAAAVYLLAYLKDGRKVVSEMLPLIQDPEPLVRNNALRVLGTLSEEHPGYPIPIKPILQAIQFPRVSDRAKAVFALYHLASQSEEVKKEILKSGVADLLELLKSVQPQSREVTHALLRKVSGQEYGISDMKKWNEWASTTQKAREISKKN